MKRYSIIFFCLVICKIQAQQSTTKDSVSCYQQPTSSTKSLENSQSNQEASPQKSDNNKKEKTEIKDNNGEKEENKKEEKKEEPKEEKKEPKSPHTFVTNVSIVSDYRFRGLSQTMRRPAIQGGFEYSHKNGIYLGTWASNVDGTAHYYNNTSMEWDFYGGLKGKLFPCLWPDLIYNIGIIYYYYPGGKTDADPSVRYDTGEFFIELAYKWISVKYWQSLTNYFGVCADDPPFDWKRNRFDHPNGSSVGSSYIEANITYDIWEKMKYNFIEGGKLTLTLHVGHVTVRNYSQIDYTEWRISLMQEFPWVNLFVSYVGTNAPERYFVVPDNAHHPHKHNLGAQGVVAGATKSF